MVKIINQIPLIFSIEPNKLSDRVVVEAYLPEYFEIKNLLKDCDMLGSFAKVTTGSTPHDKSVFEGGKYLFLKTTNIHVGRIKLDEHYFINEEGQLKVLRHSRVFPDDVLLTIIGATGEIIGRAVVFPSDLEEANINQNVARIRIEDIKKAKPLYLEAFLNSRIGRIQSKMISRVAGQFNLNLPEVRSMKIPIISELSLQDKIINIWENRKSLIKEKNEKMNSLLKIIHKDEVFLEYGIKLPELGNTDLFEIQTDELGEILTVEYYRSKLIEAKLIKEKDKVKLSELREFVNPRKNFIHPSDTPDEFFKLVKVSFHGTASLREERLGEEIKYKTMKKVKPNDIVVSRIDPSAGSIGIIDHDMSDSLVSNEYHILVAKSGIANSLYIWKILRSEYVKKILEGHFTGGSRLRIDEPKLLTIPVPKCDINVQNKFADKIKKTLVEIDLLEKEIKKIELTTQEKIEEIILNSLGGKKHDLTIVQSLIVEAEN